MQQLKIIGIFVLSLLVLSGVIFVLAQLASMKKNKNQVEIYRVTPTPTPQPNPTCGTKDVAAMLSWSVGAGNTYGTFSLKNISSRTCQFAGLNFPQANFEALNVKINETVPQQTATFVLRPGDALYSTIHLPNGPQCNSPVEEVRISYFYQLSANEKIAFRDFADNVEFFVNACQSAADMTDIDLTPWTREKPNE